MGTASSTVEPQRPALAAEPMNTGIAVITVR
jgi:hypothetical protein